MHIAEGVEGAIVGDVLEGVLRKEALDAPKREALPQVVVPLRNVELMVSEAFPARETEARRAYVDAQGAVARSARCVLQQSPYARWVLCTH